MVPHIVFLLVSANDSSKRADSEVNIVKMWDTGGDDTPFGQVTSVHLTRSSQTTQGAVVAWNGPGKENKHTQKKYKSLPLPISKSIIINLHINTSWIFPIKSPRIHQSWFLTIGILPLHHHWNFTLRPLRLVGPSARNNLCSLVWVDPVDPNIPKGRPQEARPWACE